MPSKKKPTPKKAKATATEPTVAPDKPASKWMLPPYADEDGNPTPLNPNYVAFKARKDIQEQNTVNGASKAVPIWDKAKRKDAVGAAERNSWNHDLASWNARMSGPRRID